jgi:hypothetical protein
MSGIWCINIVASRTGASVLLQQQLSPEWQPIAHHADGYSIDAPDHVPTGAHRVGITPASRAQGMDLPAVHIVRAEVYRPGAWA